MENWTSLHIFCHDYSIQDQIITELIYPVMKKMKSANDIDKWFYIRYWEGGPHIRLRILNISKRDKARIKEIITDYIAIQKMDFQLTREKYYENHKFDGEKVSIETLPWYENGSIHEIEYKKEYERYGGEEVIEYSENIFMKSSEIAARVVKNTMNNNPLRLSIAIDLFLVTIFLSDVPKYYFLKNYEKYWSVFKNYDENIFFSKDEELLIRKIENVETQKWKNNRTYNEWSQYANNQFYKIKKHLMESSTEEKMYGILSSQLHMMNNRIGIFPEMEYWIARSLRETMEEKRCTYL